MLRSTRKVTREQTKIHNSRLVLKTIFDQGEISRADIARTTDLTATTVSGIVAEAIDNGLVEEVGSITLARGKPPTLVSMVKDSRFLIGLDLARSEFQGAVMNLRGEQLHQVSIAVDGQTGDEALDLVYELIDALVKTTDNPLLGIGIAAPGIIDAGNGVVRHAVNFGWYDLPLRRLLNDRYGLPVHIANDNDVAVLAEYTFGAYKSSSDLVVVSVGHGIGAGIVLGGQLFHGHGFGAGEIGHVVVVEDGELCMCGNSGCLETIASSRAIVKRAQSIAQANPESLLHQYATDLQELKIGAVVHAYEAGDSYLQEVVVDVAYYLGVALANLVGVLSVPTILVAGSVAQFGQPLLTALREVVAKHSLAALASQTKIEFSSLDHDIIFLGTTALVLSQELGVV